MQARRRGRGERRRAASSRGPGPFCRWFRKLRPGGLRTREPCENTKKIVQIRCSSEGFSSVGHPCWS
eukprot:3277477-Pyramimonas_sp.AAC.1